MVDLILVWLQGPGGLGSWRASSGLDDGAREAVSKWRQFERWHLVGMDLPVGVGESGGAGAADGLGDCRWMGWAGETALGFSWLLDG